MKMIFQNVRCSYVFIEEPRKPSKDDDDDGNSSKKGKYSVQILIPKNDPQVKKAKALAIKVAKEKFGEKVKLGMLKMPLRDGDEERDSEEYEGMYFLNANSSKKPGIVNKANEPADADDLEQYGYSGCYFHVSVNFYGFKVEGNKGVAVGLNNVMLRKAGQRLDGSTSASDDFEEFAEEGGDDDFDDDFDDDDLD